MLDEEKIGAILDKFRRNVLTLAEEMTENARKAGLGDGQIRDIHTSGLMDVVLVKEITSECTEENGKIVDRFDDAKFLIKIEKHIAAIRKHIIKPAIDETSTITTFN